MAKNKTSLLCYVCNTEITKVNETKEHIIINAAGGRLSSKKLICSTCNSEFGDKIDDELAKQLNHLSNLFMVKRTRGKPQPVVGEERITGKKYLIEAGGKMKLYKPKVEKKVEGNQTKISISARSKKELKQILKGIAKKFPQFDVKEAMDAAKWRSEYLDKALHYQVVIGGEEVFRAVCKCATNFYIFQDGDRNEIKDLLPYIQGNKKMDIVWMHYKENIYTLKPEESFHLIHLVGNAADKTLYCYVDYFNCYKYLVLLSDNFEDKDIKETYCFDLINVVPIHRKVNINYDRKTLLNFFGNKDPNPNPLPSRRF